MKAEDISIGMAERKVPIFTDKLMTYFTKHKRME